MGRKGFTRFVSVTALCALCLFVFFAGRPIINAALHRHGADAYPATDFAIFYCAGAAIDSGRNPYLIEPLRGCEHRVWARGYLDGYAEPAALPGYAILPFALLAKLPFGQAKLVWLLLSCVFFGIAVASGERLSKVSPVFVFALLFVPIALLSIRLGQLGAILAAAIFSSALLLRNGHTRTGTAVALITMIEPHIGLPILAALLWFVPRARLLIVAAGLALFGTHFLMLGIVNGFQYFTEVLPAMSHAERIAADQYGTVWALYRFGLNGATAGLVANVLYILAIATSLVAVRVSLVRFSDRAFIVAVPAVLGLVGAPYLHDVELCGALVLPLCVLGRTQHRMFWSAIAVALAIPWYAAIHDSVIAGTSIVAGAGFLVAAAHPNLRRGIVAAAAFLAVGAVVVLLLRHLPLGAAVARVGNRDQGWLAAQSWAVYLRTQPAEVATGLQSIVPKALTWLALLIAASSAIWQRRALAPQQP